MPLSKLKKKVLNDPPYCPTEDNQDIPDGVPPQARHNKMDRYTVPNRHYPPPPGMGQPAPPGTGYSPPSYQGQQVPPTAPYSNYSYNPPPNSYPLAITHIIS